jgi:hypothetical protein
LGPLWYFQMQLFDCFHDFFHIMITGLPYLTVAPLTIWLLHYPIALVSHLSFACGSYIHLILLCRNYYSYSFLLWITCLCFIGTLSNTNPTLYHDFNVALCWMIMSPRLLAWMNTALFIAISLIAVPVSLFTLDYGLWLEMDLEMPITFFSVSCI